MVYRKNSKEIKRLLNGTCGRVNVEGTETTIEALRKEFLLLYCTAYVFGGSDYEGGFVCFKLGGKYWKLYID